MESLSSRKGILLAGGKGQRLYPLTSAVSKQLMPVYDKPMIYYPLTTLMLCGIKDILIISSPPFQEFYKRLLGDGGDLGVNFSYEVQKEPEGVAQSILIGEKFLKDSSVAIALGDNLFHGNDLISLLNSANSKQKGATIFAYPVRNPEEYGVVEFDKNGRALSIEEKPNNPKSRYAVTGLYFYDNSIVRRAKEIGFSPRGELEITSINQSYLHDDLLNVRTMGRGIAWLDTGTFDSLHEASSYIRTLEYRQGLKVGCPEEVSWRKGWINDKQLANLANSMLKSGYGEYLLKILEKP